MTRMDNRIREGLVKMRQSISVKIAIVSLLVGVLLVPLIMVWAVVAERSGRREEAAREVGATWGGAQQVGAVVLTVPYQARVKDGVGNFQTVERRARFLPEKLDIDTQLKPETRYRGIFPVTVYRAPLTLSGSFRRPDVAKLGLDESTILWDQATIAFGTTFTKGVSPDARLLWNDDPLELEPAPDTAAGLFAHGLAARVPGLGKAAADRDLSFQITFDLRGTGTLQFQPAGKITTVSLKSTWREPSFTGAFLPDARDTTPHGFTAAWRVGHFGRGYPQAWLDDEIKNEANRYGDGLSSSVSAAAFGVDLVTSVDLYQQTERSVKYGVLFVSLTFGIFLLMELLRGRRVHPVQYLLVGGALLVFYLLLLSLAEHIGFGPAYLAAATATVGLIGMYATHAFRSGREGGQAGAAIAGLYSVLFVLLRLEDYALLMGAVLLFTVLATVMYLTRRVDWYALVVPLPPEAPPSLR
jgi:inner membrane protein